MSSETPRVHPWLHRYLWFLAASTLLLIVIGGLVTSKGAGLAVPDWPNSYGYNMFLFPPSQWLGGILYEHTHRLWASVVGLLTLILAVFLYGRWSRPWFKWLGGLLMVGAGALFALQWVKLDNALFLLIVGAVSVACGFFLPLGEPGPRLPRRLALAALIIVILQGLLGGIRVVALKDEIGVFHGALAQGWFAMMCGFALIVSPVWARLTPPAADPARLRSWRRFVAVTTALIFLQLILGAVMRHEHAGLAIPDFPKAYGSWWPDLSPGAVHDYNANRLEEKAFNPITATHIVIHLLHRALACVIAVHVLIATWRAWRGMGAHLLRRLATAWTVLVALQIGLGILTVLKNKPADVATAHVAVGALILVTGVLQVLVAGRCLGVRAGASAPATGPMTARAVRPAGSATS